MNRFFGTVIWFSDKQGYGFIRPDGENRDIFFHWSYLQMDGFKTIKPDARVTFEVGDNHRGPMAIRIQIEDDFEP